MEIQQPCKIYDSKIIMLPVDVLFLYDISCWVCRNGDQNVVLEGLDLDKKSMIFGGRATHFKFSLKKMRSFKTWWLRSAEETIQSCEKIWLSWFKLSRFTFLAILSLQLQEPNIRWQVAWHQGFCPSDWKKQVFPTSSYWKKSKQKYSKTW